LAAANEGVRVVICGNPPALLVWVSIAEQAAQTPQPKPAVIAAFDNAPRFEASTFSDYATLAVMLDARNAPMAVPSAALQKLAAGIVGDAATVAAKVERLHNWVTENIRYVGIGFEDGGLTSQPADAAPYGDCKAHAVLLKALLWAQGIAAKLVAVNADVRYTLTELPTQNFNHAILYVPKSTPISIRRRRSSPSARCLRNSAASRCSTSTRGPAWQDTGGAHSSASPRL
jgi:transglutaminase-like putative cysteine protease